MSPKKKSKGSTIKDDTNVSDDIEDDEMVRKTPQLSNIRDFPT
jgi:hypothetical protein